MPVILQSLLKTFIIQFIIREWQKCSWGIGGGGTNMYSTYICIINAQWQSYSSKKVSINSTITAYTVFFFCCMKELTFLSHSDFNTRVPPIYKCPCCTHLTKKLGTNEPVQVCHLLSCRMNVWNNHPLFFIIQLVCRLNRQEHNNLSWRHIYLSSHYIRTYV